MKTIEEKNRLIAEFMGYKFNEEHEFYVDRKGNCSTIEELRFNNSWDWLMPVVEEIESIGYNVNIRRIKTSIHPLLEDKELFSWVCGDISKKLEITYNTIVQFIEWYNEQQKS